ncbi:anchored repeat-type ABC transporter ATP-binding subunit [Conexibacter stalactiti]|uniref:Anchored repeat-type ABC transporter ATP-binding subunit n=1 Tax=Conexibacter stalactiti TaxID=1940611 RepID=A0ABU4I3E9_9ACTN|nr:anchored repeat-type ABC transporter ATP-binding subunit [Conexibacter stalactiti]MDW5598789.1 anchored repeat-type ABC transporter ATP-binding subunit [Conexibacter stalactiti]MEC5039431.1 anchored repeat-type ABC transporter ATP-binding subunit [Conexibacter stalactiti]
MSAALSVRRVSVRLGGRLALRDAELEVERGELVGLIGPNGAGKTTLLRAALGLLAPHSGRVEVDGRKAAPGRVPIGYVPQRHEFAWEFPISVEDAVMTGRTGTLGLLRRPGVADWQAVDEALERVRMAELRTRPVGELSGGQRQRVLVARALALQSPLLLLDEPFTGLDMPTQELLSELFLALAREDRAVLMTTHDLAAAIYGCDRLALLNQTVVAVGAPRQLAGDAALWQRTFGIGERSPLLRILAAAA